MMDLSEGSVIRFEYKVSDNRIRTTEQYCLCSNFMGDPTSLIMTCLKVTFSFSVEKGEIDSDLRIYTAYSLDINTPKWTSLKRNAVT